MPRKKTSYVKTSVDKDKIKSTYEEFIEKLSPEEKIKFDEEYRELLLSELILAAMAEDEVSVRDLAQRAQVSPTIIQAMRSGSKDNYSMATFYKILKSLGYNQFMVGKNGHFINIDFAQFRKK